MGRWVTSKGRRIYIPDEGEENPYEKKEGPTKASLNKTSKELQAMSDEEFSKYRDEVNKHKNEDGMMGIRARAIEESNRRFFAKDQDTKEKQIAQNKAEADKLNGKNSPDEYAKSQGYTSAMQMAKEVGKNPKALEFANKLMNEGKSYQEAAALAHAAFMHNGGSVKVAQGKTVNAFVISLSESGYSIPNVQNEHGTSVGQDISKSGTITLYDSNRKIYCKADLQVDKKGGYSVSNIRKDEEYYSKNKKRK